MDKLVFASRVLYQCFKFDNHLEGNHVIMLSETKKQTQTLKQHKKENNILGNNENTVSPPVYHICNL